MFNAIRDIWLCKTGDIRKIDKRIWMLQHQRDLIVRYGNIPAFYERLGRFVILMSRKAHGQRSTNLSVRHHWSRVTASELWVMTACVNWEY